MHMHLPHAPANAQLMPWAGCTLCGEEVTSVPKFMNQPKVLPDHVLDTFKYELADELGITPKIRDGTW